MGGERVAGASVSVACAAVVLAAVVARVADARVVSMTTSGCSDSRPLAAPRRASSPTPLLPLEHKKRPRPMIKVLYNQDVYLPRVVRP